jgi:aromatase
MDPENRTVRAQRVEPGPFEFMRIHWSYREVEGGVEMRWVQHFKMRPEAPIDDEGMTRRINNNSVVQMARIQRLVEEAAQTLASPEPMAATP